MKEFNGYYFDDKQMRQRMKYIVIYNGDLDLNGVYAFRTKKDLKEFLKTGWKEVRAVFELGKDITSQMHSYTT